MNKTKENNEAVELRPHHSACLRFFVGKGYSEDFVAHTAALIKRLSNEGCLVKITNSCDELCKGCPNRTGNKCLSQEKVEKLDTKWSKALKLEIGKTYYWTDIKANFDNTIREKTLCDNCSDCNWFSLCLEIFDSLR
ncbi:MAG: DUF1284 domain-containing protein [Clostridia bacterium]|nr:DUF1284 domain-containing protein [Clostridia bacterium]